MAAVGAPGADAPLQLHLSAARLLMPPPTDTRRVSALGRFAADNVALSGGAAPAASAACRSTRATST